MEKYYIPTIEEFHVGFEFEEEFKNPNWHKLMKPRIDVYEFIKIKLDTSHSISRIISKIKKEKVKVKYLNREDIESLEWVATPNRDHIYNYRDDHNSYQLHFDDLTRKEGQGVGITIYGMDSIVFQGYIKNKSEFKKIMIMLDLE